MPSDIYGNVGSDATNNELEIETGAPVVTVSTRLVTSDTTPELSGTINDISATITVTVNGSAYAATNNGGWHLDT